jgi:L-ascorbate metabolism protein UlaG (beta-lactamase superfamily)
MKPRWIIFALLIVVAALSTIYLTLGRSWSRGPVHAPIASPDAAVPAEPNATLEITYIANEGVLIASGDKQVLIDGLHREYEPDYPFLPMAERNKIETAQAPFDKIDLVLVSHMHLDHFHPESVGLHLKHNSKAVLVSSQQVVDEVQQKFRDYQAIKGRVTGATPPLTEKVFMKVSGVDFEILGLGHGTGRHRTIQNLGHIIKLGGKKLLHVGDADTSVEIFEKFNLDEEGIDVAFLPFWFLTSANGSALVREHIKPKHIIAVHLSATDGQKEAEQVRQSFPNAAAFTTLLEKRRY